MGVRSLALLVTTAAVLLVAGCELLGGIEEIELVQALPGADAGDGGPDASDACSFGTEGDAFLRLGNLVPSDKSYDFCIKPADADGFDEVRPLLASGGGGCPAGLAYKDLTMAFRTPSGSYDVRMVAGGAQRCDAAVADVRDVRTLDNRSISVLAFEGAQAAPLLRQLPETPSTFNRSQVRFINGLVGVDAIDCGVASGPRLPASIVTPIFRDVAFGAASPAGTCAIDDIDENGYLIYGMNGVSISFGLSESGHDEALVSLGTKYALNSSNTLFAVGRMGSSEYPPALWSCNEKGVEGILAVCGDPLEVAVEVFSTQLTDLFMPLYGQRIEPVLDAIAKATSDVICVNEIRNPVHTQALLTEATRYPYAVDSVSLDLSPSDLTDQNGVLPTPHTTAACAGELAGVLGALIDCIDEHCARDDGTGHRFIEDGQRGAECVSSKCPTQAIPLLLDATREEERCWMCALTQMAGEETTEYVREACTTDPEAGFTYRGAQGLAVLSRYGIREAQRWLLPSTSWQRGLIRAAVDLPNGVALDVYCGDLTLPEAPFLFPYVGHYGGARQDADQWVGEQQLQVERVLELIQAHSGGTGARVVLATTAYAGPAVMQGDAEVLAARSPAVYERLSGSLVPLVAPDYVPACTECLSNPVFLGMDEEDMPAADRWTTHLFGLGIAKHAVLSTQVTFTEASYEVSTPDGPRMIPPSSHYGLRSVLRLTH